MKRFLLISAVIFCFTACNNGESSQSTSTDSVTVNGTSTPAKTSIPTGTGSTTMDSARTQPTITPADSSH
jgi:hypothetical protein